MEDTSLEDFLDAGDESGEEEPEPSDADSQTGDEGAEGEPEPSDADSQTGDEGAEGEPESSETDSLDEKQSPGDAPDVAPAEVTARWIADGRCCEACGSRVQRLWTDGETDVCSACKNWE